MGLVMAATGDRIHCHQAKAPSPWIVLNGGNEQNRQELSGYSAPALLEHLSG